MDKNVRAYFAKLTIDDIVRNKSLNINSDLYKAFNSYPFIDDLRNSAHQAGLSAEFIISKLNDSSDLWEKVFWINITAKFIKECQSIENKLWDLYKAAETDKLVKVEIIFRLLALDLNQEQIDGLFRFFLDTWSEIKYTEQFPNWHSGQDIYDVVVTRMNDSTIPNHKKWIYVFLSLEANNPEMTLEIVNKYKHVLGLQKYKGLINFINNANATMP